MSYRMVEPISVRDFEKLAEKKLNSVSYWSYVSGGAMHEETVLENERAFERYLLRPRVLNDVSAVDVSTSILGRKINFPVCISAFGLVWECSTADMVNSECAVAKAAQSLSVGYSLSSFSTSTIEEIATAVPTAPKFFQLYFMKGNRSAVRRCVVKAEKLGYQAIFLTVDTQVNACRYREEKHPITSEIVQSGLYWEMSSAVGKDLHVVPSLQWSDLQWLKSITKLPVVLKGILTAEMAIKAVEHGVDGIVVSNHGGRQLDCTPASIDALPEVVRAVNGRCEVYLDGGVRSGTDVLKAVALGAKAVFVGRPAIWGLLYKEQKGVERVLEIFRDEFKTSMQLMGCTSVDELQRGKDLVVRQSFYRKSLL